MELGDFFIEASKTKQVIVETHSEHMVLRIRRRVAAGDLSPDDVAIYFVERGRYGSKVRRISFGSNGLVSDWPKGFFDEDYYESLAMVIESAKKKERN